MISQHVQRRVGFGFSGLGVLNCTFMVSRVNKTDFISLIPQLHVQMLTIILLALVNPRFKLLEDPIGAFVLFSNDTLSSSTVDPAHLSVELLPERWGYLLTPVQQLQVNRGGFIFASRSCNLTCGP